MSSDPTLQALLARVEALVNPPKRLFTHLGNVREIQEPELSDLVVAGTVRMLMRHDWDHERVCTLARDRILHLSQTLEAIRAEIARSERPQEGNDG